MALATPGDLIAYGYDINAAPLLHRAEARVKGYARQEIEEGTSSVTLRPPYLLPQRPVVSVTSVTDEDGNVLVEDTDYTVEGPRIIAPDQTGRLTVAYSHGFATIPAELVEVVCAVAARMYSVPNGLKQGVTSESASGETIAYGSDAYSGVADLTSSEKAIIDRVFPHTRKVPGVAMTL